MGKRVKWKPRFRVVPGSQGRIWYMIQFRQNWCPTPYALYPCYRFFYTHQIRWFMQLKDDRRVHKKQQKRMLDWNIAMFYVYYGWVKPSYETYNEITAYWGVRGPSRTQIITNFLIDEGYAYARRGHGTPILLRESGRPRLSRLRSTFSELAASGESCSESTSA